jgi:hypothetical protein
VSRVKESAMMAKVMPTVRDEMASLVMTCSKRSTTAIRMTPHNPAVERLGTRKRSRLRNSTAPRSRSWGSTSSTTNSVIIGSEIRKFDAHSHVVGK